MHSPGSLSIPKPLRPCGVGMGFAFPASPKIRSKEPHMDIHEEKNTLVSPSIGSMRGVSIDSGGGRRGWPGAGSRKRRVADQPAGGEGDGAAVCISDPE